MRRSGAFWGAILVVLGLLLLLDNLNLLPFRVWGVFWPAMLILAGGWILLGVFVRRSAAAEEARQGLEGAAQARLTIHHGAGRLTGGGGAASGDLFSGTFVGGVEQQVTRAGDRLEVELRQSERGWWSGPWTSDHGLDWGLRLTHAVPLTLELNTGAGETRLDLSQVRVTELTVKTGASSTEITLPAAAGHTRVVVEAGAAAVVLRVPEGVAARIDAGAAVGAVDVDARRFPGQQSPDFETAANRVEITARIGAGSLSVV